MWYYLRLIGSFLRASIQEETASRVNFMVNILNSSKNHSVLVTACCFRVHLRPFTKQPTGREDTLRVPCHRAAAHTCQMDDAAEDFPRFLRVTGRVCSTPCRCFHAS